MDFDIGSLDLRHVLCKDQYPPGMEQWLREFLHTPGHVQAGCTNLGTKVGTFEGSFYQLT